MMTFRRTLFACVFCAASSSVLAADYIENGADIVKATDWAKMQTVEVVMTEHHFEPKDLAFKVGTPYRLVLKNRGELDHYYTAAEFFKAVAWRKAQTPRPRGGELKAPYFTAVEAYKGGGTVELFFVPVKRGKYPVICTLEDHEEKGMTGSITVN